MELRQHQLDAVDNLANGKVLWGGVGSGKSATVLAYYIKNEQPKDIYVITTAKKRDSLDWEREAARFGIGTKRNGTIAGTITVDSWNNIGKYIGLEDKFFIFDEQRVVGHGVWVKSFIKIAKNNNWILLSATPGDNWLDYVPVFIANNLYKNATQFSREHIVYAPWSRFPRIVRYNDVRTLEKYRNMILVEMPYLSENERVFEYIDVAYDEVTFGKVVKDRWNPYTNQPIKDVAELFRVMRRIVNSDASRLNAVKSLMEVHNRVIVFYNFDYELEILRTIGTMEDMKEGFVTVAEWNGHKHEPIPKTEKWVYLVQYVAGAEGWNCTETDTVVFYSLTYSYKNFIQAQGRVDRLDNEYHVLHYFVLFSKSLIDRAVNQSLGSKKLFNERKWAAENLGYGGDF